MSGLVGLILVVAVYVIAVLPLLLVFRKADQPGWAALIPIYNIYITLKVVGRPGWWLILFFIPLVSLIIWIIVAYDLARSFGHGAGFTVGLVLLSWIFLLILGLDSSRYLGPAAAGPPVGGPPATTAI
ncbi:MAG TPA: DUF5684 domain-containing protein [Actinomycetes bacterium]|nr:DUF5684 domain-containing protein [Actinomycetes bacterium]